MPKFKNDVPYTPSSIVALPPSSHSLLISSTISYLFF